jgi:hypothetical protein
MYNEPKHIESSYSINNVGKLLYETVITHKPKKVIDFGLLYGYSTVCLAQAVRDNGFGEIIGYDLFEDYQYKYSVKSIVEHNLQYYNLNQYVTLKKMNFYEWIENYNEDFDLLHLDISNDGDIIETVCKKYPNKVIVFEGGSKERDKCDWMVKYNKRPINDTKVNYKLLTDTFPSLSIINQNG